MRVKTSDILRRVNNSKTPLEAFEIKSRLASDFPGFDCTEDATSIVATGDLRPSPSSRTYVIQISYVSDGLASGLKIFALSPSLYELAFSRKKRIPHTYFDGSLCVYHPSKNEWNLSEGFSPLVVWTSRWLFFFENWLVTGEWLGGGEHPGEISDGK